MTTAHTSAPQIGIVRKLLMLVLFRAPTAVDARVSVLPSFHSARGCFSGFGTLVSGFMFLLTATFAISAFFLWVVWHNLSPFFNVWTAWPVFRFPFRDECGWVLLLPYLSCGKTLSARSPGTTGVMAVSLRNVKGFAPLALWKACSSFNTC